MQALEEIPKAASRTLSLRKARGAKVKEGADALGADDLLPLIVYAHANAQADADGRTCPGSWASGHALRRYVIVRSCIPSLAAELAFIEDFLPAPMQYGKEGYALVSMQCACRVCQDLSWDAPGILRSRGEVAESH